MRVSRPVDLVCDFRGESVDGRPVPEVAIPPSGEMQENPAGEAELAGLHDAGEQPVTAWPQVAQLADDAVFLGPGRLPERLRQGIGHAHAEGPERQVVNGLAVGVDEAASFAEPFAVVNGTAEHDCVEFRACFRLRLRAELRRRDLAHAGAERCGERPLRSTRRLMHTRPGCASVSPPDATVNKTDPGGQGSIVPFISRMEPTLSGVLDRRLCLRDGLASSDGRDAPTTPWT